MRRVIAGLLMLLALFSAAPATHAGWVLDGQPVTIGPSPGLGAGGICTVDPTGQRMVYGSGSGLYMAEWSQSLKSWTNISSLSLGSGGLGSEAHPCWSPDGNWLYYTAADGSNPANDKIYRAQWTGSAFNPGAAVVGDVNNGSYSPSTPMFDGSDLYFRRLVSDDRYDICKAAYNSGTDSFGTPTALGANINDGNHNEAPFVTTQDGKKTLLFDRAPSGDHYHASIMKSTDNGDGTWSDPVALSAPFNQSGYSVAPRYSAANDTLYFDYGTGDVGAVYQATPGVPEPSTFAILGTGAISLAVFAWRRRTRPA